MVKQDILGGLFSAVSRGIDLKNAMQSLYNAGYEKEEIEEAAKIIQKGQFTQDPITKKVSDYDHTFENNDRKIIAVLIVILIFLIGVLLATIIFKPEIISFINEFLNKNA